MILTIEIASEVPLKESDISEPAICCDEAGLQLLLKRLQSLKGKTDHLHLMTAGWGGAELTDKKLGGSEFVLVNHLRVVKL